MKTRIFTDGACSCNPGPGGWAAIFNRSESAETFSGNETLTTNNRMELTAATQAVIQICRIKPNKVDDFEIYSDSAYVINAVNNEWISKWKLNDWKTTKGEDVKNKDLWEQLCKYLNILKKNDITISFIKVKGHSGNCFNEMADKVAVEESNKAKKGKV